MERKSLTESMHPEEEWFKEAASIETIDGLASFIGHILNDYYHDYGTVCHAVAACALAAAWMAASKEKITGFQAGFVMWDFIGHWEKRNNKCGLRLIDYDNMLYPQYAYKFEKVIDKDTWEALQKQAKENLKKNTDAAPRVIAHWKDIVNGIVPFGYEVVDEI